MRLIANGCIAASVVKGINLCKRGSFITLRSAGLWGDGYVQYELGQSKPCSGGSTSFPEDILIVLYATVT